MTTATTMFCNSLYNETFRLFQNESEIPCEPALVGLICPLIISVFGTFGNLCVILSLMHCAPKLIKQATTKFVVNLSVSDLIFCLFSIPLTAIPFYTRTWPFGGILCQIYPIIFYGNIAVSLLSITFISFNRFIFIVFNTSYSRLYCDRAVSWMIAFSWLFPTSLLVLPLFKIWGQYGYDSYTFTCTILEHNQRSPKHFLFLMSFAVPCFAIIFCYSVIWIRMKLHSANNLVSNSKAATKREIRVTKIIFVIFTVFCVCFLPSILIELTLNKTKYPYFYVISLVLVCFSACVNPIIYFVMNLQYRKALIKLLVPSRASLKSRTESTTSTSPKINQTMTECPLRTC